VDLSPGMLALAHKRGLDATEGSATALPIPSGSFDVTCSFKVLAHVPEIGKALAEMARVTRPGGVVLAEFYNPVSLRGLVKRLGPAGKISDATRESAVYTRFDAPWVVPRCSCRTRLPRAITSASTPKPSSGRAAPFACRTSRRAPSAWRESSPRSRAIPRDFWPWPSERASSDGPRRRGRSRSTS